MTAPNRKQLEYVERAREAEEKAARTSNREMKQSWMAIARQWIELAKSAERNDLT